MTRQDPRRSDGATFPWRDGWEPFDPLRPCYTCGATTRNYFDRQHNQPLYACSHDPFIEGPDDPPTGTWSTKATAEEWEEAFERSARIIKMNEQRGWQSKFIPREGKLLAGARGIVAEIVASRLTGLPHDKSYLGTGYRKRRKKPDIGANVEVRNTRGHHDELALYDNDPDDRIALLVTGTDPFVLRGWIRVRHGRLKRFWTRSRDLERWLVPQSLLHPMPLPQGS